MKRSALFFFVLLATVLATGGAQGAVGDFARGNFYGVGAGGKCVRVAYDAATSSSGTSGTITHTKYKCDGTGTTGDSFSGNVTCLSRTGNRVVLSGPITSKSGFFAPFTSFREFGFDNSTPSSSTNPDRFFNEGLNGPPDCTGAPPGVFTVQQGDIRVGGTAPSNPGRSL